MAPFDLMGEGGGTGTLLLERFPRIRRNLWEKDPILGQSGALQIAKVKNRPEKMENLSIDVDPTVTANEIHMEKGV